MASNFSIELFKVPFDNSYKKVFDINSVQNNSIDYREIFYNVVLSKQGDREQILSPAVSNIKRYNNRIIFTIRNNYFDTRKYNYIVLKYENTYFFYFIIDVISENDNPVNPATTITGEYDVWHNNLNNIYKDRIINKNTIIKGHRNRYLSNTKILPYNIIDNKLPVTKTQYLKEKKVAFLKLTFSKEFVNNLTVKYLVNGTTYINSTDNYLLPQHNGAIVYYIPMYITDGERLYNCTFQSKEYQCFYGLISHTINSLVVDGTVFIQNTFDYYGVEKYNFLIGGEYASYISKAEITFNSPFPYTIDSENNCIIDAPGGIITDYEKIFIKTDTGEMESPILFFGVPKTSKNISDIEVGLTYIKNYLSQNNNYSISIDTPLERHLRENGVETNINSNDYKSNEIALFQYPFNYVTLYINDNEYIFNLPHTEYELSENTYNIEVNNDNNECFINIYYKGEKINDKSIFLKNSGLVSYSVDALEDYLIRNGSQEKTAVILNGVSNALSIIGNGLSGNIIGTLKSGVDAIGNPISIMSKHKDLNNTPSSMSNSSNGETDLLFQDRIVIYVNQIKDKNVLDEIYQILYIYGYEYKIISDIFDNSRFWFDYKQTQNCKLNNRINANDKQRIEQMFDDGVHMFHINYDENSSTYYVNTNMEFDGKNNIERSIATI